MRSNNLLSVFYILFRGIKHILKDERPFRVKAVHGATSESELASGRQDFPNEENPH